jgi:hypothetical protein
VRSKSQSYSEIREVGTAIGETVEGRSTVSERLAIAEV